MDYLKELAFLTLTAGGDVIKTFTQRLSNPNPRTFIGEGKTAEIKEYILKNHIKTVIFDDELSATQERNISKIFNCKILDRTNLILDIFASVLISIKKKSIFHLISILKAYVVFIFEIPKIIFIKRVGLFNKGKLKKNILPFEYFIIGKKRFSDL